MQAAQQPAALSRIKIGVGDRRSRKYEPNRSAHGCLARDLFTISVYWGVLCQQLHVHLGIMTQLSYI